MQIRQSSHSNTQEINKELTKRDILHLPDVIGIYPQHLGDESDHVASKFKSIYTYRYFQLLKSHI
jgi:hypothetical protein